MPATTTISPESENPNSASVRLDHDELFCAIPQEIVRAAMRQRFTGTEHDVLLAVFFGCYRDRRQGGRAQPLSLGQLVRFTARARSRVAEALADLERRKVLVVDRPGHAGTNLYRVAPPADWRPSSPVDGTSPAEGTSPVRGTRGGPAYGTKGSPADGTTVEEEKKQEEESANALSERAREAELVFEAWKAATGSRGQLQGRRREQVVARVAARLAEGFSIDDLQQVVTDGWKNDDWPDRPKQNDILILLRDAGQVEKFLRLADAGPPARKLFKPDGRAELVGRQIAAYGAAAEALEAEEPQLLPAGGRP